MYDQLLMRYMPLLSFKEFKSDILHGFRLIGNCVTFIQQLDELLVHPFT
jgi:hypothetical protein